MFTFTRVDQVADRPIREEDILHAGSPYGKLHQMLNGVNTSALFDGVNMSTPSTADPLPASMAFTIDARVHIDAQPWLELVTTGTFSVCVCLCVCGYLFMCV